MSSKNKKNNAYEKSKGNVYEMWLNEPSLLRLGLKLKLRKEIFTALL
jgi:hypothetical protein